MARRSDDPKDVYLVIHGHFYQPPRENPWLDAIQREPGAAPYPNWNARIADECYRRNGWARIFDDRGRVEQIVNNYRYLSFNFGATLLTWLERQMPDVYERMLEADRKSAEERGGHGNAIAQSYGHAILPLCNRRDRLTLIRWGLRDFEARFGRPAEALWLPETGVNAETVEDLIDEGVRYIVLSPYQARRVRPLVGEGEDAPAWTDVSPGKVDPRMPYRCRSGRDPKRHLDVFFYDGPVSHSVSFERVLDTSKRFVDRLWGAVDPEREGPQLVHAAVDGETFGHHHRHAERALAYVFSEEAPARGFRLTNYGQFLELCPPTFEVELELGPGGEGTAWSCSHGVGRWYRDCGCNAGAPAGWNQAWRGPLRRAADLVRDEAARVFEEQGGALLSDPWRTRDDYVELLLDGRPEARARFIGRHAVGSHGLGRQVRILKLLEMEYFSLMSQTSCGWFFDDISGLEATQVMKYMARTVQLMEELGGRNVEQRLLEVLAEAHSNFEGMGNGAEIYRDKVLSASVDTRRFVAQYAITDMFRDYADEVTLYGHQIHRVERNRYQSGPLSLVLGRVEVEHARTAETADMVYLLIHFGAHDFHCAVGAFPGYHEFRAFARRFEAMFENASITELLRAVDAQFGETFYGLPQLLQEEREMVLDELFDDMREHFAEMYTRLYMDNRRTVNALIDSGLKVPREFRMAAEYTLSRQLNEEIRRQHGSRDRDRYHRAEEIVAEAAHGGYELDLSESEDLFGRMLRRAVDNLGLSPCEQACLDALDILSLMRALKITLPSDGPQNTLYELLRGGELADEIGTTAQPLLADLLERLRLSPKLLPATAGA